ncbi:MAG: glycosyltransferase family 9 protein, partial [Planctomycetota bacterium]
ADSMRERGAVAPCTGNLRQLAYLLSHADLFIGGDTGPMHIASALKVPVVALFGPKDPEQTGPYCSRSVVVTGKADCRPCTRRRCSHVRCMASIRADKVLHAALDVLDGGGECRGREGPIKKPLTWSFQLGRWRGEITTCYSRPEFYRRLCNPDALLSAEGSRLIKPGSSRVATSVPAEAGAPGARLVVKRYHPKARLYGQLGDILAGDRAFNSWRSALKLGRRGVPIPFPVCHMVRGGDWHKEHVLITEEVSDAATLHDWLMADDMSNWRNASAVERTGLMSRVATLIRGLHAAGYFHADLRAKNILLEHRREGATNLYLIDTDRTTWVGWLPPMWRDIFFGLDLRRFASQLKVPVSGADAARFFRCYCDGFVPELHRQRTLRRIVRYPRRHGGSGSRRFTLARTGLAGEREEART